MSGQSPAPLQPAGPASDTAPHAPAAPADAAMRAIEEAHRSFDAAAGVLAGGGDERVDRAQEHTAACTTSIARALWFLRRAQRERERGGAPPP